MSCLCSIRYPAIRTMEVGDADLSAHWQCSFHLLPLWAALCHLSRAGTSAHQRDRQETTHYRTLAKRTAPLFRRTLSLKSKDDSYQVDICHAFGTVHRHICQPVRFDVPQISLATSSQSTISRINIRIHGVRQDQDTRSEQTPAWSDSKEDPCQVSTRRAEPLYIETTCPTNLYSGLFGMTSKSSYFLLRFLMDPGFRI
jgi:hypothetical protein